MSLTVIVVDDQWSMQALARMVLESAGYRVLTAGDAVTGLSLVRLEHPALVLVDTHLPEMDGFTMARMMRQDPQTAAIPVIFVMPQATDLPVSGRWLTGPSQYLRKPYQPTDLLATVDRILTGQSMPLAV